jgi:uncharacterized protein YjaG (DUF416 family)
MPINEVRSRFSGLTNSLSQLSAIAMAQRLLPGYETFSIKYQHLTQLTALSNALLLAWKWLGSPDGPLDTVSIQIRQVEELIPNTDDYDDDVVSFGLDSAAAVHLALSSFIHNPLKCLNDVSIISADSADQAVQRVMNIETFASDAEMAILSHHPIMIKEAIAQSALVDIACNALNMADAIAKCQIFSAKNQGSVGLLT